MASSKELKPLMKEAKRQGWDVVTTRNGRIKWTPPKGLPKGGLPYFSASTPSDRRAIHNITADLTKRGLTVAK
jgi:hypothetical protein